MKQHMGDGDFLRTLFSPSSQEQLDFARPSPQRFMFALVFEAWRANPACCHNKSSGSVAGRAWSMFLALVPMNEQKGMNWRNGEQTLWFSTGWRIGLVFHPNSRVVESYDKLRRTSVRPFL
jgi:hypothetical protein